MKHNIDNQVLRKLNMTTIKLYNSTVRSAVWLLLLMVIVAGSTTTSMAGVVVKGNVYGGGNEANVGGSVTVDMTGGTVDGDVYGGGALANTNIGNATNYGTASETISSTSTNTTTVILNGGTIKGDAYGGGLGDLAAKGGTHSDVAATVYGDITVYLGCVKSGDNIVEADHATVFQITNYQDNAETSDIDESKIVKSGRIFGTNNLNGSPKGNVTVNIFKTEKGNKERTASEDLHNDNATHDYEVAAVYGGGNLANFTTSGKKTNVIIHSCDVSVESVYGGGNAAAAPETDVLVKGAYEIRYVFGGGNGKDPYTLDNGEHWTGNGGANVNGNASTLLIGGYIHEAYGGSNEKGTITGSTKLEADQRDERACDLNVVKLVGAGNNADIDGDVKLILGCMPATSTISEIYGGANNANVNGNVELTITSGNFTNVYGGNNLGGLIKGHIKLNIEETGCCPINIENLYLGGNQAAYSVYGYYLDGSTYKPRTKAMYEAGNPAAVTGGHTIPYDAPELNIISCTSIGHVYGGGYGSTAAMYGSPTVNINMIPGEHKTSTHTLGAIGDVYGGGEEAPVYGDATVNIGTATTVTLTSVEDNTETTDINEQTPTVEGANITGNVYGGGKDAIIDGNTVVNIGTIAYTTEGFEKVTIAGDIYGGGEGHTTNVTGTAQVNLGANGVGNSTVSGDIYGGSAFGNVGTTDVKLYHGTASKSVFGGGKGQLADNSVSPALVAYTAQISHSATVSLLGATVTEDIYGGCNVNGTAEATTVYLLAGSARNAFGGGLGENTGVTGNVNVEVGKYDSSANPAISGSATVHDVYGGSAKGKVNNDDENNTTNTKTTHTVVNLYAGSVTGDVYGGGLGTADIAAQGEDPAVPGIAALVYGDVAVKLNEHNGTAIVGGSVFGCNNLKGSPKGAVTVDVYGTNNSTGSKYDKLVSEATSSDPDYIKATDAEVSAHNYDLTGVFGGGNLATYAPTNGTITTVTIHGCSSSSIKEVYGGGNAADVPGCAVNVYGAYEIGYVYAGGKGQKNGVNGATSDAAANVNGNATSINILR